MTPVGIFKNAITKSPETDKFDPSCLVKDSGAVAEISRLHSAPISMSSSMPNPVFQLNDNFLGPKTASFGLTPPPMSHNSNFLTVTAPSHRYRAKSSVDGQNTLSKEIVQYMQGRYFFLYIMFTIKRGKDQRRMIVVENVNAEKPMEIVTPRKFEMQRVLETPQGVVFHSPSLHGKNLYLERSLYLFFLFIVLAMIHLIRLVLDLVHRFLQMF